MACKRTKNKVYQHNNILTLLPYNVQEEVWNPIEDNKFDFCMYNFEASSSSPGCCLDDASYTNDHLSFSSGYTSTIFSSTHSILTSPTNSSISLPTLIPPQNNKTNLTGPVGLSDLSDSMMPIDPCPTPLSLPVFELVNPLSPLPTSQLWMDSVKPHISCNISTNIASDIGSLNIDRAPKDSPGEVIAASGLVCLPHPVYDSSESQV